MLGAHILRPSEHPVLDFIKRFYLVDGVLHYTATVLHIFSHHCFPGFHFVKNVLKPFDIHHCLLLASFEDISTFADML
jgi:hypothetical protein